MHTFQLTLGGLAAVTASSLIGLGATAAHADTTTVKERGNLLECTGTFRGKDVFASLYENNLYGNTIQVVIGDGGLGGSRQVAKGFLDGRAVRGSVKVDGKRAVVTGTAHRVGPRIAIHDQQDDAGQHITVDGFHRRLASDLVLDYRGRTVPLTCDNAFHYRLTVTKEDLAD